MHSAPILNSIAPLDEVAKWIPLSNQRYTSITTDSGVMRVDDSGEWYESIAIAVRFDEASIVKTYHKSLDQSSFHFSVYLSRKMADSSLPSLEDALQTSYAIHQ